MVAYNSNPDTVDQIADDLPMYEVIPYVPSMEPFFAMSPTPAYPGDIVVFVLDHPLLGIDHKHLL